MNCLQCSANYRLSLDRYYALKTSNGITPLMMLYVFQKATAASPGDYFKNRGA